MPSFAIVPTPMVCLKTANDVTEFWTKEKRDANPDTEPPVKVDDNGNALFSVEFTRKEEIFGKMKSVLFSVTMPKNHVDPELLKGKNPGFYTLINPVVSVYADRNKPGVIRESWSADGMTDSSDSEEL